MRLLRALVLTASILLTSTGSARGDSSPSGEAELGVEEVLRSVERSFPLIAAAAREQDEANGALSRSPWRAPRWPPNPSSSKGSSDPLVELVVVLGKQHVAAQWSALPHDGVDVQDGSSEVIDIERLRKEHDPL